LNQAIRTQDFSPRLKPKNRLQAGCLEEVG